MVQNIECCRLCKSDKLKQSLDLGVMSFSGIFPTNIATTVPSDNMSITKCENCGLVQLEQVYNLNVLYGDTYGYRSGLNSGMVRHLGDIVNLCESITELKENDTVLDIGSNDGTLLKCYKMKNINRWGVDPLVKKFYSYYEQDIMTISDFFDKEKFIAHAGVMKPKIITTISMFYDLPDPLKFAQDICEILHNDGIWLTEQSYFPAMIASNSYDTICQEHLEYYALKQIHYITSKLNMKIIAVNFNDTNGGSFQVMISHRNSKYDECTELLNTILQQESHDGYDTNEPTLRLKQNMEQHREELVAFLKDAKSRGQKVYGYGASTKGNVLLQYCGINADLMPKIAEVNSDKFGSYTPGTLIPIVAETLAKEEKPDYFLVLPWHFKRSIIAREQQYLQSGGKFVFPLPQFEIVSHV